MHINEYDEYIKILTVSTQRYVHQVIGELTST